MILVLVESSQIMPRLTYVSFDGVTHTHELTEGTTRIGRTRDNDLPIDELAVSAHHCEVRCTGQAMFLKDLDSADGTYVDGEPITAREIKVGQLLALGAFIIRVEESASAANRPRATPPPFASVQLADGSYSCLRHQTRRALFQCEQCFDLACEECVTTGLVEAAQGQAACRACGATCQAIDWSGLTMGKKEALLGLLPEPVRMAMEYLAKRKGKSPP